MSYITWNCMKSIRIQSFSGPYSIRMWESTDQKNSEYGHFSPSVVLPNNCQFSDFT